VRILPALSALRIASSSLLESPLLGVLKVLMLIGRDGISGDDSGEK